MQADAADGFVFAPHLTPGGFDEFVEKVVPVLQERGVYRREYAAATLRSNLGLPDPTEESSSLRHLSQTA